MRATYTKLHHPLSYTNCPFVTPGALEGDCITMLYHHLHASYTVSLTGDTSTDVLSYTSCPSREAPSSCYTFTYIPLTPRVIQ